MQNNEIIEYSAIEAGYNPQFIYSERLSAEARRFKNSAVRKSPILKEFLH